MFANKSLVAMVVAATIVVAACSDDGSSSAPPTTEAVAPATTSTTVAERNDAACSGAAWMDPTLEPVERTELLLPQLSLEQKISQVHGAAPEDDFRLVPGIEELCIPDLTVTNGPAGVGPGAIILEGVPATALPSPLLLAATWDPGMASRFGDVIGAEMIATGRNLMESPDVDLARVPTNGRTFEAFGEDPLLVSRIGVAQIEAVQDHGILAMVKHFVANNQETDRGTVSAEVSERALRELYYPPFEAAVADADVSSVMCSYNRVNGTYSCESEELLTGVLRDDWGFEGFVQTDFFAQGSTVGSAQAGLDLEMPTGAYFGEPLLQAVQSGEVSEALVDDMVGRRFTEMFRLGTFDRPVTTSEIPVEEHAETAQTIAAAGTVLLRNEGDLLPLDEENFESVAVVGPWADQTAVGGGGSSQVTPLRTITPVEGIEALVGDTTTVLTADGVDPGSAAAAAAGADVAIVVVGDRQSEGEDRDNLTLVDDQDAVVAAVAAANPNTVVVIHAGAPVLMPWIDDVAAVVMGWYPGQEDGTVTAALLFGDVAPAGRLPITFPAADSDVPANTPERYPGVDGLALYDEGLEVGYRHYTANDIDPLFPFGFGLSYTSFEVSDLAVTPDELSDAPSESNGVSVSVEVHNAGERAGTEVVQVYVSYPDEVGEPPVQLRGFAKIELEPGASEEVEITLDERALAYWDEATDAWTTAPGTYEILVGTSSEDLPLTTRVTIGG